jgi:hypothetical protein
LFWLLAVGILELLNGQRCDWGDVVVLTLGWCVIAELSGFDVVLIVMGKSLGVLRFLGEGAVWEGKQGGED